MKKNFQKILIANRGEIARRLIHAVRELGYISVLVYSEADRDSLPVQEADEAHALQGIEVKETYLDIEQILEIAKRAKVDAVHPGYGFLSENREFAMRCLEAGIEFIGPHPEAIHRLGDKIEAKLLAEAAGVPTVPGYKDELPELPDLQEIADKIGYPLLIKAAAGGGGKGMRIVRESKDLAEAIAAAQREALAYFRNDKVFLEKYLEEPRHIEVQILGDKHGNIVHLFERECSLQRRHQKVIEESPSPSIPPTVREALCAAAVRLAKEVKYYSAGTVEFIVDRENNFYFLEVNTRLQVEHPVTELVTGIDLVKAQIKIAEGHHLPLTQSDIVQRGHAIECRLYAEDPENNFLPSEGTVAVLREPQRPGVRIDSALQEGKPILSLYDPMLAKLIVSATNRKEALMKMKLLLQDYVLLGLRHNIDFLRFLVESPVFLQGHYHTHSVAMLLESYFQELPQLSTQACALAVAALSTPSLQDTKVAQNFDFDFWEKLREFRNI